jgi:hypothetical protein
MATTRDDIVEIICDWFNLSADYKDKYHPYILDVWIASAFGDVLFNICGTAIKNRDYAQLDPFIKAYKVKVECDEHRNEFYSVLPVGVVALPENRGIYRITPLKDQRTQFYFRENGTNNIYDELEFSTQSTIPAFYQELNKIYYNNKMTADVAEKGVLMKLIPNFNEYDGDDVIPLPNGKGNSILSMVIQELSQKPTPDFHPDKNKQQ